MNKNKVILTGAPRSATTSMAQFFELFSVPSYHQKMVGPPQIHRPYDILKPPPDVEEWISRKSAAIKQSIGFEASWSFCFYIYDLNMAAPWVTWLIVLREPMAVCNSWKAHNEGGTPINVLAQRYNEIYQSMIKQIKMLPESMRPKWIDFETYTRGGYIEAFLNLFSIPTVGAAMELARGHLKKKIRTSGPYARHESVYFNQGRDLKAQIKDLIPELE